MRIKRYRQQSRTAALLPNTQKPNAATWNAVSEHAKQVVNFEAARCDMRSSFSPDIGVPNEGLLQIDVPGYVTVRNIYWRARRAMTKISDKLLES